MAPISQLVVELMSHRLVFPATLLVPVQTIPGPVLVITAYSVELATLFEMNPAAPWGSIRLVQFPEPAMAPVYLMSAIVPRLAMGRLMLFVPLRVKVPQFTSATAGLLARVGATAKVPPGTPDAPLKVNLPRLAVALPT